MVKIITEYIIIGHEVVKAYTNILKDPSTNAEETIMSVAMKSLIDEATKSLNRNTDIPNILSSIGGR
jgi:hypothetical protein